jgi:hypothetical protein
MNNIHQHLEFKLTVEENNNISYLDLLIHRDSNSLQLGIYRKPLQMDTTIHFTSSHPLEQRFSNLFKWGPLLLVRMFYRPPYSCPL